MTVVNLPRSGHFIKIASRPNQAMLIKIPKMSRAVYLRQICMI